MIKRIIFFIETRFNLRDYKRFGIEILKENGFDVEVWNFSPVLHPKVFAAYTSSDAYSYEGERLFKEFVEIECKFSTLSDTDFVINCLGYTFANLKIYKALNRSLTNYAVFYSNLPQPVIEKRGIHFLIHCLKQVMSIRHSKVRKHLFMKLPFRWLGAKAACLALSGGSKCFNYNHPLDRNIEVLHVHSFDYDIYLKEKEKPCVEKPIAVFLDEFLPFHPDYGVVKSEPFISADRYYPLLCNFFDRVEKEIGLEVVIAAHPRSNYEELPDYFRGRKYIRGDTVNLVRESKMVMAHCSTSLNFTNLFNKPVVFITCRDLDKTYHGLYIKEFGSWFGKKPVFIDDKDNDIDWKKELIISKSHYDNYRQAYIKIDKSEDLPFWQIVAKRLKERFK